MKIAILSTLLVLLVATPALAEDARPTLDVKTLTGAWQGAMVMTMAGDTMVMPVTFTFGADGKVQLASPGQKTETNAYSVDAKAGTVTFRTESGKIDMLLRGAKLSMGGPGGKSLSLIGKPGPEDVSSLPKGMSMALYLGKLARQ